VSDGLTTRQDENFEYLKFLRSQIDAFSSYGNKSRFKIDAKILSIDYVGSPMTETSEQYADSSQKFLHPERLDHIVVCPRIERQNFVALCRPVHLLQPVVRRSRVARFCRASVRPGAAYLYRRE